MPRYRQGWSKGWKKSTRGASGEWYDSSWELQYMDELDRDPMVIRWTRHHGLRISYRKWWGGNGRYEPDFLVELFGDAKELREVKGEHLLRDPNTTRKLRAGDEFCRARGMTYRLVTKSPVNPDTWAPGQPVEIHESAASARPPMAEGLEAGHGRGCLAAAAAVFIVVGALALALFLLLT